MKAMANWSSTKFFRGMRSNKTVFIHKCNLFILTSVLRNCRLHKTTQLKYAVCSNKGPAVVMTDQPICAARMYNFSL